MRFLEAKDKSLADVLSNNRFRIDSFQREYRWQRKHIEALISDLAISFDKYYQPNDTIESYKDYGSYYMGPIVLCDDNKELSIVDGQQRLTSFTLLLIYLLHTVVDEDMKSEIKKHLYVRKGGKNTLILNVESRTETIEHLITNSLEVLSDNDTIQEYKEFNNTKDESIGNIIARYEDITLLFPEDFKHQDKLQIFIEWLLNHVVLVEITAFSMESAYTIFETMNDRGMSLNPTEILKGYLLSMIDDEDKGEEMNEFWKERIFDLKSAIGVDTDVDFFRNWLRAKYAESKRSTTKGSENLDFELIGTQFHSWVKNNASKLYLKKSDDFYLFIKSDFNFYSNLYINLFKYKNYNNENFRSLYITNFYTIAESLVYPLFLSPISKIDDKESINKKIHLVNKFIDTYTVFRSLLSKSITQSSIRNFMYELIKEIRNTDFDELNSILKLKIGEIQENRNRVYSNLQPMNNWGFYHYFFARLMYFTSENHESIDFQDLMRSRKQSSFILVPIFFQDDFENEDIDESSIYMQLNSVANHILIRRYDSDKYFSTKINKRIDFLIKHKYLLANDDINSQIPISEFIQSRDNAISKLCSEIWG
ncbi:DUF262 domain-containing protein [Flavobacterium microcysteis]|uniref:DUF262 domain-containing protein n=1 Tax=Flavobacterium microcysteis TaxID=2596891 RepID=A0A501QFN3_9FLAO|nr:DUF262 domain-containing protein [Flavobacterium microcysteis]TPD71278.1 DUF262 domain-containing protein [Flavobacterium microcysteis]